MKKFAKTKKDIKLTMINDLIKRFDQHLNLVRGLARITREANCRYIRVFLNNNIKSKKSKIKNLRPNDLYRFILSYAQESKPSRTQRMICALRTFFRFLELFDLANSLPSVPHTWPKMPEYLSFDQLQKLLNSCDRKTPGGIQAYSIMMLLIHLGLRRSEVTNLNLNDFDWDTGEVEVRGKGSTSRMPISQELGNALVDYLKHARPTCTSNSFFIRLKQPYTKLPASSVSLIVRSGLLRAGINTQHKGAHLLRHSFATLLLAEGRSLFEISMVLRHQSIKSTAIYAHVDRDNLRLIALPWPIASEGVHHE